MVVVQQPQMVMQQPQMVVVNNGMVMTQQNNLGNITTLPFYKPGISLTEAMAGPFWHIDPFLCCYSLFCHTCAIGEVHAFATSPPGRANYDKCLPCCLGCMAASCVGYFCGSLGLGACGVHTRQELEARLGHKYPGNAMPNCCMDCLCHGKLLFYKDRYSFGIYLCSSFFLYIYLIYVLFLLDVMFEQDVFVHRVTSPKS